MIIRAAFLVTALTLMPLPAAAQAANLTGEWRRFPRAGTAQAIDPLEPESETIVQTLLDVQITQRWGTRVLAQTRTFDGVERDSATLSGSVRTTSLWQGDRLVTATRRTVSLPQGTATVDVREVRYLDGDRMMLDITWTSGTTTLNRRVSYARVLQ